MSLLSLLLSQITLVVTVLDPLPEGGWMLKLQRELEQHLAEGGLVDFVSMAQQFLAAEL